MASINTYLDTSVDVEISAEEWINGADDKEKKEMRSLIYADDSIGIMLQDNHFLKQKVVFALNEFNSKENITALGDLIREIEDL